MKQGSRDPTPTQDTFLGGQLTLLQARSGLRAGLDAVFLAASVPFPPKGGARLLDLGTGSGVVGLCALARSGESTLVGIDRSSELVDLARQNAATNGMAGRTAFYVGDALSISDTMSGCGLMANSFDHVLANPPFFEAGTVQQSPSNLKDHANVMQPGDLDGWVRFMTQATKAHGLMTMIHKACSLPLLLRTLDGRFGDLVVFPLFPRAGASANRVIVRGRKGARGAISLCSGMTVHEADGKFTTSAEEILRHGKALDLA